MSTAAFKEWAGRNLGPLVVGVNDQEWAKSQEAWEASEARLLEYLHLPEDTLLAASLGLYPKTWGMCADTGGYKCNSCGGKLCGQDGKRKSRESRSAQSGPTATRGPRTSDRRLTFALSAEQRTKLRSCVME